MSMSRVRFILIGDVLHFTTQYTVYVEYAVCELAFVLGRAQGRGLIYTPTLRTLALRLCAVPVPVFALLR